jgi:hypothetical protein
MNVKGNIKIFSKTFQDKKEAPTKVEAISPSANPIEFDGIWKALVQISFPFGILSGSLYIK